MNVFPNYVTNKYITIDDEDPVWINEIIKSKIKTKNLLFKQHIQSRRFKSEFIAQETLITEIIELIVEICIIKSLQKNLKIHYYK